MSLRIVLGLMALLLMVGCSGLGGPVGYLEVHIVGLPENLAAQVGIENLSGLSQHFVSSQTLPLSAGNYAVSAEAVTQNEKSYLPNPSRKVIEVRAGSVSQLEIVYSQPQPKVSTGALQVNILGLPDSVKADLSVEGISFSQKLFSNQTLSNLNPGNYAVSAQSVVVNGLIYGPNLPKQSIEVLAGQTSTVNVGYLLPDSSVTLSGMIQTPATSAGLNIPAESQMVPGEAIVKWKQDVPASLRASAVRGLGKGLELMRQPSQVSLQSVRVSATQASSTLEWIAALRARDDVEFAEPNYWRQASQTQAAPNDPLFVSNQPPFNLINLGEAWQATMGSADVVVAVLDTGILWRNGNTAATHPDFSCGRILPGYDFVSYSQNGDGTGRDPDPYSAPGDDHGSHVAGTIGACSNNGIGVSGVDWKARILPVRVLGLYGGTDADILDALRWSVGISVNGVPNNPYPAKVINMSLGGLGFSQAYESVVNQVVERGVIVVVAAGNSNDDAMRYSPAGLERVITVGAIDATGAKAAFSNYGSGVEVMAPGVNILSTAEGSNAGTFGYKTMSGTSMASPHVARVVALMAALKPDLTWVEAFDYLTKGAQPIAGCSVCGAGLMNAADAVQRAKRRDAVGGFITPSARFDFGSVQNESTVKLTNYGSSSLQWVAPQDNRLSLSPSSATLAPGESIEAKLILKRPNQNGTFYSNLLLDGGNHKTNLFVQYWNGTAVSDLGEIKLALCADGANGSSLVTGGSVAYNGSYNFNLKIPPVMGKNYYLRAWVDANNDGITEYMTSRVYLTLDGKNQIQNLSLGKMNYTLSSQGCIAM